RSAVLSPSSRPGSGGGGKWGAGSAVGGGGKGIVLVPRPPEKTPPDNPDKNNGAVPGPRSPGLSPAFFGRVWGRGGRGPAARAAARRRVGAPTRWRRSVSDTIPPNAIRSPPSQIHGTSGL